MNQEESNLLNRISHECLLHLGGRMINVCFQIGILSKDEGQAGENIHSHPQYEVHYGGSGGSEIIIEGDTLKLKSREIIIVAPGIYHTGLPAKNKEKKKGFYYYFMTDCKNSITKPIDFKVGYRLIYDNFDFGETFDKIVSEFITEKTGHSEKVTNLLSCLLIDMLRVVDGGENKIRSRQACEKSPISILDRFFTLQYNCNPNKAELANQLSVSKRQLERILKETYGMTFKGKVQKTRFDTANYYLRNLGYPSGTVAELVGYSCENSFYSAYKKYFGFTPSQYLLQMSSNPQNQEH